MMHVHPLDDTYLQPTLAFLRQAPYRNALLLSNVSQLRDQCDVAVAERDGQIVGVGSTYHALPTPNLVFAAPSAVVCAALVAHLVDRNQRLRGGPVLAILPEQHFQQLHSFTNMLDFTIEYQMVVEPETLNTPTAPQPQRLTRADLVAMNELAAAAELPVWHESALDLGPAFGCFANGRLVAMAATHFATTEIIEIGHIATHPGYRRRGFAKACTAALAQAAFALAPRVFLMVLESNVPARATYRALGFVPMERFYTAHILVTT